MFKGIRLNTVLNQKWDLDAEPTTVNSDKQLTPWAQKLHSFLGPVYKKRF